MRRLILLVVLSALLASSAPASERDLAEIRAQVRTLRWAVGLLSAQLIAVCETARHEGVSVEFQEVLAAAIQACEQILAALNYVSVQ